MNEGPPESVLLERAQAGDDAAFVALCDRHRGQVWRIASSVARGADAEDLTQEVVIRAFRALKTYRGSAPFGAWICRIAVNAAHDHVRSAWRRRVFLFGEMFEATQDETVEGADGAFETREVQRRVRQAVAGLAECQRIPIWLHFFEGYAVAEVARLEGAPEATIRSRIRAGLRRMARSLADLVVDAGEPFPVLSGRQKECRVG